jgi:hypothetical protein
VSSFAPDPDWETGRWNPVYRTGLRRQGAPMSLR